MHYGNSCDGMQPSYNNLQSKCVLSKGDNFDPFI